MTLRERMRDLTEMFGPRNAVYLRGKREIFLFDAVRKLGKMIRNQDQDKALLSAALASVFGRVNALAESFYNLPIPEALSEKYPASQCAYCQQMPCHCSGRREKKITYAPITETNAQLEWTVSDWCRHMDLIYGAGNHSRGLLAAHSRLAEEVGEVISVLLVDANDRRCTLKEVRQQLSREFADVFAWIFSLAAMLEIDLEVALDAHYPADSHRRCGCRPCNCGPFLFYQRK